MRESIQVAKMMGAYMSRRERIFRNAFSAIAFIVMLFSFAGESLADEAGVLAVIDSKPITVEKFRSEMERLGHGLPGRFATAQERENLLDGMVNSEILFAAAKKDGYENRKDMLEAFRVLITAKYREEKLDPEISKITVTDAEIETYYQGHRQEFKEPEAVRAAIIRISIPPKATPEKKAELLKMAEEARTEALKLGPETRSFGSLAVKYSDDQTTRYRGGDSGLYKKGDKLKWEDKVSDAIFFLKEPGELSPVITSGMGYYLVKLMEKRAGKELPLTEVKEMVRSKLFHAKKEKVEKDFFDRLKNEIEVSVNSSLLESISPPNAGLPEPPALPGGGRVKR